MSRLDDLKAELAAGHPDTGPYNADDTLAAAELNVVNRTLDRSEMPGHEVFNAIPEADFGSLSAADQQQVWDIVHMGTVNPFGLEADIFVAIFGNPSTTIGALKLARVLNVSRAVELNLGRIGPGLVTEARKV